MKNLILPVLITVLFMFGCSSSDNVIAPSTKPGETASLNLPIIGYFDSSNTQQAVGMLGAYELNINPVEMNADLISKRFNTIGESYIVSGKDFFTIAPCGDCLKIKSISLTSAGEVQLTFDIRHPFQPGDPTKPPSAQNRLDLDIFDLALIVRPQNTTPNNYTLTGSDVYNSVLVNSAGYTRELNDVLTDPAALPYVLVIDDSISGTPTYNEFAMGASATFDAVFNFSGDLSFDLYLTMGYGASAKKAQRLRPTYFNPEFNRKAAWKVDVVPPEGSNPPEIGNTWQNNDSSTPFNVTIKVYDWQIGATVNPDLTNPTDIFAASEVGSVSVEIPGMTDSLPIVTSASSGTGTPSDPLIFMVPIANENSLESGEYTALVKVSDQRTPGISVTGGETDTLVNDSGVVLSWYSMPEFATYQTFKATVVIGCGPVTGSITSPTCPVTGVPNGSSINFSATASSGNGGDPVVLYEWDMDYDGNPSQFNVDATGQDVTLGPFTNPNCPSSTPPPVSYTVAVRGTDSCTPPNHTVFATCQVTVDSCQVPPVGNVIIDVNRRALADKYAIDEAGAFTLSWTAPGSGIPEYAIYKDANPADGLTNNLVIVGTTTTTNFTDTVSTYPTNRYIQGWTYIVRSRGIAGSPGSESTDSEPAFVTTNGWETQTAWQTAGEGWLCGQESGYNAYYNHPFTITVEGQAQGAVSVRSSPFLGGNYMSYAGRWDSMVKQTPVVSNSSVRFLDFSLWIYQMYAPQGMIIGTCPYAPGLSWSTTSDFEWGQAESTGGYWGYNTSSTDATSTFGNLPTGNNAWINAYSSDGRKLAGGDVNVGGDPSDQYIGIVWVKLDTLGIQQYPFVDELAIVVY